MLRLVGWTWTVWGLTILGFIREFPKIRGTSFWGPCNKRSYYLGCYTRVPYFRKTPIRFSDLQLKGCASNHGGRDRLTATKLRFARSARLISIGGSLVRSFDCRHVCSSLLSSERGAPNILEHELSTLKLRIRLRSPRTSCLTLHS